jgi:hypothetical protein
MAKRYTQTKFQELLRGKSPRTLQRYAQSGQIEIVHETYIIVPDDFNVNDFQKSVNSPKGKRYTR